MKEEPKSTQLIELPANKAKRIIGLKESAYKDYTAARILFLKNQIHQAAFFANTCIEKELKASLITLGIECKIKHDTLKLLNLMRINNIEVVNKINSDFLKTLTKVYESRYHEGLNPGYNFVVVKWKFLAELDYTYDLLEKKIRYKRKRMEQANFESPFEQEREPNSANISEENYIHLNIAKEIFLEKKDFVYEFRVLENHEVMEAFYSIQTNTDLSKFVYTALKPHDNKRSFSVSHSPDLVDKSAMRIIRNGISQPLNIH